MFSTKLIHPNQEIEYEIAHSPVRALKHSYGSNLRRAKSLDLPRDAFERRVSEEKFRSLKEHLKRFEEENNEDGEEKDEHSSSSEDDDEERRDEEEDEISLAGNARRRLRRNSSRKSSNRSDERRDGKHHRRAPQTSSSSSKSRRKKYRFPLASLIDFRKLGRHKRYADLTMSRPLMRGWLHCLLASVGYPI